MFPVNVNFLCDKHECHKNETPMSPCRFKCKKCKKKKVHGWSNPDHICNPFGYLFLAPKICLDCSEKYEVCMWCDIIKK